MLGNTSHTKLFEIGVIYSFSIFVHKLAWTGVIQLIFSSTLIPTFMKVHKLVTSLTFL